MASKSANILMIFVIAVIAFCLASVCASITGPISFMPEQNATGVSLDNLSVLPEDNGSNTNTYVYKDNAKDSDDDDGDDSSDDSSSKETTKDKSSKKDTSGSSRSESSSSSSQSGGSSVETTTDSGGSSDVETTTSD